MDIAGPYEELRRRLDTHRIIMQMLIEELARIGTIDKSSLIESLEIAVDTGRRENQPSEVIEEFRRMAEALVRSKP